MSAPDNDAPPGVRGGAAFLSGSLMAGEVAAPSVGSPGMNGFIMKDTVIIRTGGAW